MSGGHCFHEPENGKASLCPVDIFFMSLKTEKRVFVRGTLIHEPENRKASFCPGDIFFMSLKTEKRVYVQGTLIHEPEIDSSTLNRSNWSSSARFLGSFLPRGS